MKKQNNVLRYVVIMVIGVLMNLIFSKLASAFELPMWLDMVGTAFAAVTLEPAAGLLVGLANNFFEAAFLYDISSILYFVVSAAAALIAGIVMRKDGKVRFSRIFPAMLLMVVVTTLLSTLLTLWRTGGIPDAVWEMRFFDMAKGWGWSNWMACGFGTGILKVFDTLAMAVIVTLSYLITPKAFKTVKLHKAQSLKE